MICDLLANKREFWSVAQGENTFSHIGFGLHQGASAACLVVLLTRKAATITSVWRASDGFLLQGSVISQGLQPIHAIVDRAKMSQQHVKKSQMSVTADGIRIWFHVSGQPENYQPQTLDLWMVNAQPGQIKYGYS